jgi:phosphoribosylformylglycinamidine synthase
MEIWVIGPDPTSNLAGSRIQSQLGDLGGRPTAPDPSIARELIEIAADLAHRVPVLHDVSDGGLAVAIAEICIASGVGAIIEPAAMHLLFGEDPHRVVAVMEPGWSPLPMGRRIGTMSGHAIVIGDESIALETAGDIWRNALGRALTG